MATTLDQVLTELDDTASYEADASVALARRRQTALRRLLGKAPQITSNSGTSTTLPIAAYQAMLDEVTAWLAVNDSRGQPAAGGVRQFSLETFRG